MKPRVLLPVAFALAGAVATTGNAFALTLGRAQGIPLIGRGLEISVPVTLDGPADPMPECVDADVFYGDTRLSRERVTSEVLPAPSGASIVLRTRLAVNEPVVTVYLQIGCTSRLTRRLVLFAEQPDPEADRLAEARAARQAVPTLPPFAAPAASSPERPAAGAARARARGDDRRTAPSRAAVSPAPAQSAQARTPSAAPSVAAASASRPASRTARQPQGRAAQARLKLEPLDLSAAVDPRLRMTDGMAAPGPANSEQRALAIALWKALNARPEDLLRDAQRLQAMENDLRSLRQSIQRNEAALVEMRGQLQEAQHQRYANPLVYLLALLALLGANGARTRTRRPRQPARQWWSGPDGDADVLDADRAALRPDPRDQWDFSPSPAQAAPAARRSSTDSRPSGDSSAPASSAAEAPAAAQAPAAPAKPPAFSQSLGSEFQGSQLGPRALKAEELHDVQQEADFFVSLGEYDRAIELLRSHITTNPQTSAVAWLDLINIFHLLGRRMEYDEVRREFQGLFNAQVPSYDTYDEEMPGLEDYPGAMERICALWPHPRVLEVIEESIFRGPASDGSQAFSLEAYRDLLMLHHIGTEALVDAREDEAVRLPSFSTGGPDGKAVDADGEDGEAAPAFAATSISPLLAISAGSQPTVEMDAVEPMDPLPEIGLDINLEDMVPDEPMIGSAAAESPAVEPPPGSNGHLLDFDLPEIDMSSLTTKKTRE